MSWAATGSKSSDDDDFPPCEFICPITKTIMKDPVVTTCGHTFERNAIWACSKCPFDNNSLNGDVSSNCDLKNKIEAYVEQRSPHDFLSLVNPSLLNTKVSVEKQTRKKKSGTETNSADFVTEEGAHEMLKKGGTFYYRSNDVFFQDYKKSAEWYTKAAEAGNASAQFNLGLCYYKGQGVPQDYKKAVQWYKKAAEAGDANAQCNLGLCCKNGQEGLPPDYKSAVEWFTKAAEAGNANAQCNLGTCYKNGEGVPQDKNKAVEWFTKAARSR